MSGAATTIDPAGMVTAATNQVTSGINDNEGKVATVAGGLLALGLVWGLVRKFIRVR